jgi:hypothetical protein
VTELGAPGLRAGLVEALDALMMLTPQTVGRWPGLTEAVHWLVDDTWWDQRDVAESIGWMVRDEQEVAVIRAVLDPLLAVLDDLGPLEPDSEYLRHRRWPDVRDAAANAHRTLTRPA